MNDKTQPDLNNTSSSASKEISNDISHNSAESLSESKQRKREIRSYVIRDGRITPGQLRALDECWVSYGLDVHNGVLDLDAVFPESNPTVLEIGFGMGDSLFEMSQGDSNTNYIGVEVHRPGVGHLLQLANKAELRNLRLFKDDSIDVLKQCISDKSLAKIQIFFPDPWHKKKHHKLRLISEEFVELLKSKLKDDGVLHIATDWMPYAEYIREVMVHWREVAVPARPITKYEKRGLRLNHEVTDLAYAKPS